MPRFIGAFFQRSPKNTTIPTCRVPLYDTADRVRLRIREHQTRRVHRLLTAARARRSDTCDHYIGP
ncbi:MAG TPA: hypothetical protein VKE70_04105 [Candidatus Solibacter sp.]|nr:hypothetical protein [Candidatus Solibacter sp.]